MLSDRNKFNNQIISFDNSDANHLSEHLNEQIEFFEFLTFDQSGQDSSQLIITQQNISAILKNLRISKIKLENEPALNFLTKDSTLQFAIEKGIDSFLLELLHIHPNLEDFYIINAYRINPRIQKFSLEKRLELLKLHWIFQAFLSEEELKNLPSTYCIKANLGSVTAEALTIIGNNAEFGEKRMPEMELLLAAGRVEYSAFFANALYLVYENYPFFLLAFHAFPFIAIGIINNLKQEDLARLWHDGRIFSNDGISLIWHAVRSSNPHLLPLILSRLDQATISSSFNKEHYCPLKTSLIFQPKHISLLLKFARISDLIFASESGDTPLHAITSYQPNMLKNILTRFSTKDFLKLNQAIETAKSDKYGSVETNDKLIALIEPYLNKANDIYCTLTRASSLTHEALQEKFGLTRHQSGMIISLLSRIDLKNFNKESSLELPSLFSIFYSPKLPILSAPEILLNVVDRVIKYQKFNEPFLEVTK